MIKMAVRIMGGVALGVLSGHLLTSCMTEPVTGRKQLNFISSGEEIKLGLTSFDSLKKEMPVSKDPALNTQLQKVGHRIASVCSNDLPNAQWEFVVFESKEANAFCLPGGKVGVYTGIFPITKDEAGLATVIGHEVAHAAAHHGSERMTVELARQGLGNYISASVSEKHASWLSAATNVYGFGSQLLGSLPHSRLQESAADRIGLSYMARAGYDPQAAVQFWQRFAEYDKASGSQTPWFLRTHPLDEARIKDIQKYLPEAQKAKASP
jgi:predicted Zn-dependent protease